jgi:uncharacterized protein YprB with RNaseH-like and TPR domain
MAKQKPVDLYIDAEWFLNQRIFLIGYSHDHKKCRQIYGKQLNKRNINRILKKVTGTIFCYGPDIGMLEKFFHVKIRKKYRCVNLMKVFKDTIKIGSFKLKQLEERFGINRKVVKYKTSIFQIWKDWKDKIKKKAVLLYNREDVINLVKLAMKIFKKFKVVEEYLEEIRLK